MVRKLADQQPMICRTRASGSYSGKRRVLGSGTLTRGPKRSRQRRIWERKKELEGKGRKDCTIQLLILARTLNASNGRTLLDQDGKVIGHLREKTIATGGGESYRNRKSKVISART